MEFSATIGQEQFTFSQINQSSYLVTSNRVSVIIYKGKGWQCADDVPDVLISQLGRVVDQYCERGGSREPGRP